MNLQKRIYRVTVILLIGLLIGCTNPTAQAENSTTPVSSSISVWGTGQVAAKPDRAVLTIGVESSAIQASAALSQNNKQMQTTIDALQQAGVADRDIQTESVQLYPRYEVPATTTPSSPPSANQTSGYTAANTVQVTVRNLTTLGKLLDAAVSAGGNRIQGLRFEVSDPNTALQQARELAWQDAQHRAQQLAALGGLQLGAVLSVQENGAQPASASPSAATGSQVPIEPGTQNVQVNLNVTWQVH